MYRPNQGQTSYIQEGVLANIRSDGRRNREIRPIDLQYQILLHCHGSCLLFQEQENIKIYCGIKLEISDKPNIVISIESMKRKSFNLRKDLDKQKLDYLTQCINENVINKIDKSHLTIINGKKYWCLSVEVFLLNYADESLIEYISQSIVGAFKDLSIPKLKILHNHLTNEDHFELIEGQKEEFHFSVPSIIIIGQIGQEQVRDLTFDEYHSMEKKYLVSILEKKIINIQTFDEFKVAYNPEDLLRVMEFIKAI